MPQNRQPASAIPANTRPDSPANISATIASLVEPRLLQSAGPIASRFIYSLRLVAVHQRAKRDPVPELASRLNSVEVAAKALALSQSICAAWPESIHVSRFCCSRLTHDEATIADMIESAHGRDFPAFERTIQGLIRPDRQHRLWEGALDLVEAELRAI